MPCSMIRNSTFQGASLRSDCPFLIKIMYGHHSPLTYGDSEARSNASCRPLLRLSLLYQDNVPQHLTQPAPATIRPMGRHEHPLATRCRAVSSAAPGEQTTARPIPILKVRSMSAFETFPASRMMPKTVGMGKAARSIVASREEGKIRFRLSCMPPPVIWARPLSAASPNNPRTGL